MHKIIVKQFPLLDHSHADKLSSWNTSKNATTKDDISFLPASFFLMLMGILHILVCQYRDRLYASFQSFAPEK